MAETAVQYVIELLAQLIHDEVTLQIGLPKDIEVITSSLKDIQAILKSADKRAEEDDREKLWVNKVRDLAYEIEDAIEEYQLLQKKHALGFHKHPKFLRKRNLAKQIRKIHHNVAGVVRTRDDREHIIAERGSQDAQVPGSSPCLIDESELIDAQTPKGQIIKLIKLDDTAMKRETVAVLGMRGLGKTTVVGSVYNDPQVRYYFRIRAWIDASQPCSHTNILRIMREQFTASAREMVTLEQAFASTSCQDNRDDIISKGEISSPELIRNYLKTKRYMVVFDDVHDNELTDFVKSVLPANNKGSKILITTRNENVARVWLDRSYHGLYKLQPLAREKAWELFCKKTYQSDVRGQWPTGLYSLARGIVDRCEGLPLAILAIGRLLSTKPNLQNELKRVHDNLGSYLEENSPISCGIYKTLIRDFHDLEHYLKPCFLYFGLFPRGYVVKRMRLIRLWMAEGFIGKKGVLTLEEVAEEYLNELTNMSLVEVVSKDRAGNTKTLRVHEFLHEMILNKLEELYFCKVLTKNRLPLDGKPRRLSILNDHVFKSEEVLEHINRCNVSKVRSIILFEQEKEIFPNVLTASFLNMVHLLKVLDLCNAPIHDIPDAVGRLLHLHYLSLRNTSVQKLPSSIENLRDLQTLDLKQSYIFELPHEIHKLHKLRHLIAYHYWDDRTFSYHVSKVLGVTLGGGALRNFRELQKLAFFNVLHREEELGNLKQLRKLGLVNLSERVNGYALCAAIEGMTHLQALNMIAENKSESIDFLEHIKSPPASLQRLYLSGRLKSFPSILQLDSLVKVRLRWSNMSSNPLQFLGRLPNLLELQLLEAYDGDTIVFGSSGFQKLKVLHLLDLHKLRFLYTEKLALPLLEEMSIGESPSLFMPTSIQLLSKLQTLFFYGMPEYFCRSIQPGGQHYSIVKHVPKVLCTPKRSG